MDFPSPSRLRRKQKIARGTVRKFKPRLLPRDKYDVRLLFGVYSLLVLAVIPAAWVWMAIPYVISHLLHLGSGATLLLVLLQTSLWFWGALRALVSHVEVADDGLRVVGPRSRTVAWNDIEAVEPLGRGETIRAMLRWPFWEWNLQMSGGVTFGGYVRIRTKSGTIIFGPENRAAFLSELHTHLYRKNPKVEIPVWQWHEVRASTAQTTPDNIQPLGRSDTL